MSVEDVVQKYKGAWKLSMMSVEDMFHTAKLSCKGAWNTHKSDECGSCRDIFQKCKFLHVHGSSLMSVEDVVQNI